jgi:hypothetical protein
VLPGLHGRYCYRAVEVIVQANVYSFEVIALQQVLVIGIHIGNVEPGRDVPGEGFVDIGYGHDLRAGDSLIDFHMLLTALSRADQPDANGTVF